MTPLLLFVDAAVRVSLILALGLAATTLLRRRSAAMRHWILSATVVCALVAPLFTWFGPAWTGTLPESWSRRPATALAADVQVQAVDGAAGGRDAPAAHAVVSADARPIRPPSWIIWIWLAGLAVCLAQLGAGLARLHRVTRRSRDVEAGPWADCLRRTHRTMGLGRRVRLVWSRHPTLLVTWGAARPAVILPRAAMDWSPDRIRVVVEHELAHIARHDWLMQMSGELLRAIYWFNPLAWLVIRRLRRESEHACDDSVLRSGLQGHEYAGQLLALALEFGRQRRAALPALTMARTSGLEGRISAMVNGTLDHGFGTRRARVGSLLVLVGLTVAIAAAQSGVSTVSGSVLDATGRPVPGAGVVIRHTDSAAETRTHTGTQGTYVFDGLPSGDYRLTVSLPGFQTHVVENIALSGAPQTVGDVVLEVGSLSESVSIAGRRDAAPAARAVPRTMLFRQTADPTACTSGDAGGDIKEPRKLIDVRPLYPTHLQTAGTGGIVILEGVVTTSGTVGSLKVLREVHPELAAAAVAAVRQWTYSPTLLNCEPVEVTVTVTMNFETR